MSERRSSQLRPRGAEPEKVNGSPRNLADAPMFADPTLWAPSTTPSSHPAAPSTISAAPPAAGRLQGWLDQNSAIDWALVRRLKRQSVDKVEDLAKQYRQRHDREASPDDLRELGKPIIGSVVADHARAAAAGGELWPPAVEDRYFKAVFDSQFGYGRLQPLFEIPTATDVTVHGFDSVHVLHNDGRQERLPPVADSDEELMEQLRQMASNARPRRAFDAANLDMTLMIDERFRVHAISNEIGVRPRIAIRQHHLVKVSLADLAARGMMPDYVASLLDAAVRANFTVAVVGEQGVGKTSTLRALIDAVPITEPFGTLETDLELFAHRMPGRDNVMALYARSGMGERNQAGGLAGAVGISDMVDMALRQSLQRLIIGELRGSESSAVFQAMQTGAGTMFTTHSRDAETAPIRLASRVAEGRVYTVEEAMRQIGLLVDLIVYVEKIDDTERGGGLRRQISNIVACSPGDNGRPAFGEVYTTDLDGHPLTFTPPEKMLAKLDRHRRATLHRYEQGR
jgi:pilus assembly protein CpaF